MQVQSATSPPLLLLPLPGSAQPETAMSAITVWIDSQPGDPSDYEFKGRPHNGHVWQKSRAITCRSRAGVAQGRGANDTTAQLLRAGLWRHAWRRCGDTKTSAFDYLDPLPPSLLRRAPRSRCLGRRRRAFALSEPIFDHELGQRHQQPASPQPSAPSGRPPVVECARARGDAREAGPDACGREGAVQWTFGAWVGRIG